MDGLDVDLRLARGGFRLEVAFQAPPTGVTALFGPSGCGKTSLLRCVAGLERGVGHCRLNGEAWQDDATGRFMPTHRRPIGYVFQEASLFPHLSVRRNLEFGRQRVPAGERRVGLDEVVDLLGIGRMLDRDPSGLSGGERQRVSMARALLTSPRLLLMDEPLSALDHQSKHDILPYLERLHETLAIPVLYVSHSPDEVARLADRLVLLESGRVRAEGAAADLFTRVDLPLARDDGAAALFDGWVVGHDPHYHLNRVQTPGGTLYVVGAERPPGARVRVRIQARDVSIALDEPGTSSILNILPARIAAIEPIDTGQMLIRLEVGQGGAVALLARITRRSNDLLHLHPGQEVFAQVKAVALME
jgi:molybdate transport system ATP-binding protein